MRTPEQAQAQKKIQEFKKEFKELMEKYDLYIYPDINQECPQYDTIEFYIHGEYSFQVKDSYIGKTNFK